MTKLEWAWRNRKIDACKTSSLIEHKEEPIKLSLTKVSDKTKFRASAYDTMIR